MEDDEGKEEPREEGGRKRGETINGIILADCVGGENKEGCRWGGESVYLPLPSPPIPATNRICLGLVITGGGGVAEEGGGRG